MTPQVSLVAMTIGNVVEDPGHVLELSPGEFIAYAARVSNPANQHNVETSPRLLKYLQRAKHWSPFEMSNVVLKIVTTRDIAHQILRHWSFRFQEFSQRYAEATKFHTDFKARRQDNKNRQNSIDDMDEETIAWWYQQQQLVADYTATVYKAALNRGIAKEMSRKVLPEGLTETTIYMNGSVRSWMHYLAQRLDATTQKEHRDVAVAIEQVLGDNIPEVFSNVDDEAHA